MEAKKTLIIRIYQVLEKYSDAEHPLTHVDIIDRLRQDYGIVCERKAVGRNISYLKEMNFAIETSKKGSYLDERPLEQSELRMLIDSVLSSRHISASHSKHLIAKLIDMGGHDFKAQMQHIYSVKEWDKTENQELFLNVDTAGKAIDDNVKIKFDYYHVGVDKRLHKSDKPHIGSPYQMLLHNQHYYLMTRDDALEKICYFRLDRIKNMTLLKELRYPLKKNKGFETGIKFSELATSLPYMYSDEITTIRLKCKATNAMTDALNDWFGLDYTAKKTDDSYMEVTLRASEQAMLYWALQYNENVEVLSPQSLRDEVIKKLKSTLAIYDE